MAQHYLDTLAFLLSFVASHCARLWPTQPPAYPYYPGREVSVLNGTWDFAYLGDVPLVPQAPLSARWQQVSVPDAFDLRPNVPACTECWPTLSESQAKLSNERCKRCCDRANGRYGDDACWDLLLRLETNQFNISFDRCCGRDPLHGHRGVGAYRTEVSSPPNAGAVLLFGGCTFRCLVSVDGIFLADHSGLSPFVVEVHPATSTRAEIPVIRTVMVLVDNRFNMQTHPVHQPHYDWYQAGGLIRPVQFHALSAAIPGRASGVCYITGVDVIPVSSHDVDIHVHVSADAAVMNHFVHRWRIDDDGPADRCDVTEMWGFIEGTRSLHGITVPHAKTWGIRRPRLHLLKVALLASDEGPVIDCIEVRFGLRIVETRGRELLLNGEAIKVVGYNRHDMTDTPVLSYDDIVNDVAILQAAGANFVRGAHYAQDQRFLDMCDVKGILVWEEVLGWQNTADDFANPLFMKQSLQMLREMVMASMNHPSVIFWGFFNEGHSHNESEATAAAYGIMSRQLRELSRGTRLISWGSNRGMDDKQLVHADVCSFHFYAAWYPTDQPVDLNEVQRIPMVLDIFGDWVKENYPTKPFLITEAGAGALYGHHGPTDRKWTEEYQSLLLQMYLLAVMRSDRIAGIAFWQFADVIIDPNVSDESHRPRGLNNKGIVSLKREKKVSFHALQALTAPSPAPYFGLVLPESEVNRLAGVLRV